MAFSRENLQELSRRAAPMNVDERRESVQTMREQLQTFSREMYRSMEAVSFASEFLAQGSRPDFGRQNEPSFSGLNLDYIVLDDRIVPETTPRRVSAAQIQAEVFRAGEADLLEPLLADNPEPVASERVRTLLDMGFTQQEEVRTYRSNHRLWQIQDDIARRKRNDWQLCQRMALRYPAYKYIRHDTLNRVLTKYGLITKPTADFIGTIPDANVQEMARFHQQVKLHDDDRALLGSVDAASYFIAAPRDQFREEVGNGFGMKWSPTLQWLIDDPIVLKPVLGGVLIVTVWGEEASDPDVLNERHN